MTTSTTLQFATVIIPLSILLWTIYARRLHPLSSIPGPFWASVTRLWLTYHVWKGDSGGVQRALHRKYGPLVRIAPDEIACADPEAIGKIYPTQAPLAKTSFYPIWRSNAFAGHNDNFTETDERVHGERRRIVNNIYNMSTVLTLEPYIDECGDLLVHRLGELADASVVVDLGEWLQWYAFDVLGELFFGRTFGFMQHSRDHEQYIESLDTIVPVLATAGVSGPVTRFFIFASSMFKSTTRSALAAFDSISNAARTRVRERREQVTRREQRMDLLQHLLDVVQEKGEKVDFGIVDVEREAFVALLAGSDTTAIALNSVFYYLMKNAQTQKDLQAEIDRAVTMGKLSAPPQYSEAVKLPLLRATIKEAMRLHPSVGLTMPRHVSPSGLELCGNHIPAGWKVGMNAAVVGRDQSTYGQDADQFRPARWFGSDSAAMDRHSLVFGAGKRTCIGKNISLSEIYKLVPLVVRNLDLALSRPESEWTTQHSWFNKQTGIVVRLSRRSH